MSQVATLLQALAALAWPAIIGFIVWLSRDSIKNLLDTFRSRSFTVNVAGIELTAQEASTQQQKLISDLQDQIIELREKLQLLPSQRGGDNSTQSTVQNSRVNSILWVDDNPRNNAYLIDKLSQAGISVVTALSTEQAIDIFLHGKFDMVITDLVRTESGTINPLAGLALVNSVRAIDRAIPIVVYTDSNTMRRNMGVMDELIKVGINAVTGSPTALLEWVFEWTEQGSPDT